jgi:hypothetical protein
VPLVAAEELVAALARERDAHRAARGPRHRERGDRARVREGLVEARDRVLGQRRQLGVRHHDLVVLAAERLGNGARVRALVVARILEAGGEGAHAVDTRMPHRGHDRGAVDAAGEERPERHVAPEPAADRRVEQPVEGARHLGAVAVEPLAARGGGLGAQREPLVPRHPPAAELEPKRMAR